VKLKQIIILLFSLALASPAIAQGYQKDSLQIKVYTEIEYEQYRVKSIKATRVFCDYCSENQTKKIKEEALRLAYLARNNRDYILEKGIKKLAMYIRVSKKDFAALKEDEPDN
jgi:hypothetical protein